MIVYAPANLPAGRPLLISMHGMNQDANYQKGQANYEAVADTAKFVVVYPDGEGKSWDIGGDKDINFILDIINEMSKRYSIDLNRVYLSGFSMGGMMTYHAMTKIADRIAAFAPVSGYLMGGPNTNSSRPVPIMHVHGTSDDVCVYGNVQGHIDAWVRRNGCSTTAKVEKPKSGPANTSAEIYRYTGGQEGVEVAHLRLPGKGHWHSNDPVVAMTNIEIWNFLSRWSLASGPKVESVTPEDGSFDMDPKVDNTFVFQLDHPADCSKARCAIYDGTGTINLELSETGFSSTLTFTLPEGANVKDVEYRMQLREICGEDGGKTPTSYYHYTYGVQEVGEVMHIDTLLIQDWYGQQSTIGEGIPVGWHRVNSRGNGDKDERLSGAANCGGSRMKYFQTGGDFDAGFYFSSRDYDQATFTYGDTKDHALRLTRGHYCLSFNSAFWNDGARNNNVKFGVSVLNSTNGNSIYSSSSLASTGCLSESSEKKVTGSKAHDLEFEVIIASNYLVQYNISAGWDGVILGPPTLTRRPSQADRYKGEYLRTLRQARELLSQINLDVNPDYAAQKESLSAAISEYSLLESFPSILPSAYESARLALLEAMKPLEALPLSVVRMDRRPQARRFDLLGRPSTQSSLFLIKAAGSSK